MGVFHVMVGTYWLMLRAPKVSPKRSHTRAATLGDRANASRSEKTTSCAIIEKYTVTYTLINPTMTYTVRYTVTYIVTYTMPYTVAYTVKYTVIYTVTNTVIYTMTYTVTYTSKTFPHTHRSNRDTYASTGLDIALTR